VGRSARCCGLPFLRLQQEVGKIRQVVEPDVGGRLGVRQESRISLYADRHRAHSVSYEHVVLGVTDKRDPELPWHVGGEEVLHDEIPMLWPFHANPWVVRS
jgi:hypothetical protein